jgi:hypothetical protein
MPLTASRPESARVGLWVDPSESSRPAPLGGRLTRTLETRESARGARCKRDLRAGDLLRELALPRVCPTCGEAFYPLRQTQRICRPSCRRPRRQPGLLDNLEAMTT